VVVLLTLIAKSSLIQSVIWRLFRAFDRKFVLLLIDSIAVGCMQDCSGTYYRKLPDRRIECSNCYIICP
jgi:hypothetical protein